MYTCSTKRMAELISTFSQFGDAGHGGVTRYALSEADNLARKEFVRRMEALGCTIEVDDLGCVYATLAGSDPDAKRIVMGSHSDSVRNGGNYDGILGVMSAMEVLTTVAKEGIEHTHPLCAMIWTNEEGSLYPPAMMCSGIICHEHLPASIASGFETEAMMNSLDILEHKTTFGQTLEASEWHGDPAARISPANSLCYLETHIEQGPILEAAGCDVGVVDCVLGMFNYTVRFLGQTTHAGTFPMPRRKDALFAAAQALIALHEQIDALGHEDLVYTTGEVLCHPNVHTCVPDSFEFSLDVRHTDAAVLEEVRRVVLGLAERKWAGCTCEVELAWQRDTVEFDSRLRSYVEQAASEAGISHMDIHSGAGHDAQFAAYMLPTTMIFVQSRDGLSHCEDEWSSAEHCSEGATVMLNAALKADVEFEAK